EQNFSRAELRYAACPIDRVEARRIAPTVRIDFPATRRRGSSIDCGDDALRAVATRGFGEQGGIFHARGIAAALGGAGVKQRADVVDSRYAAADGQRNEYLIGDRLDHAVEQRARLDARPDVEERQLVGSLPVIAACDLDGVPRIAQVDEIHALDDTPVGYVETRDDSLGEAHRHIVGLNSFRLDATFGLT